MFLVAIAMAGLGSELEELAAKCPAPAVWSEPAATAGSSYEDYEGFLRRRATWARAQEKTGVQRSYLEWLSSNTRADERTPLDLDYGCYSHQQVHGKS